jgi:purine-nucleoside phosphorylase
MATPNNIPPQSIDYFVHSTYAKAAEYLVERLPNALKKIDVGIICGSGLGGLADVLEDPKMEFEYKDIPNFAVSTGNLLK